MNKCIYCKKEVPKGIYCTNKCLLKRLDEKYPDRKHYAGKERGFYYIFRSKEARDDAYENGMDNSWYSGIGCITTCPKCGNKQYLPPLPKEIYMDYSKRDWKVECFKHLRELLAQQEKNEKNISA